MIRETGRCEIGECKNIGELEQTFRNHKIRICSTCRVQAYKLTTHYLEKIYRAETDLITEFFEAIKGG